MNKKKPNRETTEIAKPYEPTANERRAFESIRVRQRKTPKVRVSQKKDGVSLSLDHPDQFYGRYPLMEALGTSDPDFFGPLLTQLAKAATQGENVDERAINFMVSVIKGVQPKDQLETMLAMQMAAVHMLTMDFARRLNNVANIPQQDSAERTLNKLARTFAAQVEAFKRYRSGGEQRVTVEHVTVNEGGKAIVGNVTNRGASSAQKVETTS
jgi:hypothetical protein